jgi:hypothetical protein
MRLPRFGFAQNVCDGMLEMCIKALLDLFSMGQTNLEFFYDLSHVRNASCTKVHLERLLHLHLW